MKRSFYPLGYHGNYLIGIVHYGIRLQKKGTGTRATTKSQH